MPGDLLKPYAGGQVARGGRLGMLGNVDVMDAPFNTTNYTAKIIEDQQARTVADVLINDPSVRSNSAVGGFYEAFSIRGFQVQSRDIAFNGLPGMVSFFTVPVEAAERVEIFKGPGAFLSGMAASEAIGGSINLVPKRAGDVPLTRLTTGFAGNRGGIHVDVGRRLGEDNEFGIRLNGVHREGPTNVGDQAVRSGLGALALDYRGELVRLSLDFINLSERIKYPQPHVSFAGGVGAAPDVSKSLGISQGTKEHATATVVRGEVDLTPKLTAYASMGTRRSRFKGYVWNPVSTAQGVATGAVLQVAQKSDTTSADVGVNGSFPTGAVSHRWAANYTSYEEQYGQAAVLSGARTLNLYAPTSSPVFADAVGSAPTARVSQLRSFGVSDTMSMVNDRVTLTLGLRHQQVRVDNRTTLSRTYDQSAVSPMAGMIVKPWDRVSLYGNYIEGLKQGPVVAANLGLTNAGQVFPPFKAKQYEAGVKVDFGVVTTTVSMFQIAQPSMLTVGNTVTLDGKQRNRGLEFNVFGELARKVRLLGGATFTDSNITRGTDAVEGKSGPGTPRATVNIGAEWDLPAVPGLTLTSRALYTGSQYLDAANTQQIPAWRRLDVGLRYATRIAGKPVILRASVENLLKKNYWTGAYFGTVSIGAPRTFLVSTSVDY
ncbi:MAG: TonB-dependent siderophore receptor [Alcaligenaceae bacterium]|nr:MAG: TonB-dependent siderophore receptor [Alcaligenaceae bacterium]